MYKPDKWELFHKISCAQADKAIFETEIPIEKIKVNSPLYDLWLKEYDKHMKYLNDKEFKRSVSTEQ